MLRMIKKLIAVIMSPAKGLNMISEKMREERILSKTVLWIITLIVGITNLKEGCFQGEGAIVNIAVFLIVLFIMRIMLRHMENLFYFVIEKITLIPSRLFDICIK